MPQRARRLPLVAGFAVAALAVAGCVPENTPPAYDDVVRGEFIQACTGNLPETDETTTSLASQGFCECAYQAFVDNIPYDEDQRGDYPGYTGMTFVAYNAEVQSEPSTPLPQVVADTISSECPSADGSGPLVGPTVPEGGDASTSSTTGEPSAN